MFALISLLINAVIFTLTIVYGTSRFNQLLNYLTQQWAWLEWFTWLLWPLFLLLMLAFVFFAFTDLANLIAAPFNGGLSEAVEEVLTRVPIRKSGEPDSFLKEALTSIRSEAEKIRYILLQCLPLLILFMIPVIQLAAPFVWFMYAAWMIALEYIEIPLGNRGMLFPQIPSLASENRTLVLGYGAGILLLTMLPGINLMIMPMAVSDATKMVL